MIPIWIKEKKSPICQHWSENNVYLQKVNNYWKTLELRIILTCKLAFKSFKFLKNSSGNKANKICDLRRYQITNITIFKYKNTWKIIKSQNFLTVLVLQSMSQWLHLSKGVLYDVHKLTGPVNVINEDDFCRAHASVKYSWICEDFFHNFNFYSSRTFFCFVCNGLKEF